MTVERYVGRVVEIVYMDSKGRFSKRTIRILRVEAGIVHAFDVSRNGPRRFDHERILAAQPVVRDAS